MYTYIVQATYLSRTIEFEISANSIGSALQKGEEEAKKQFSVSMELSFWGKESKVKVRKKK